MSKLRTLAPLYRSTNTSTTKLLGGSLVVLVLVGRTSGARVRSLGIGVQSFRSNDAEVR